MDEKYHDAIEQSASKWIENFQSNNTLTHLDILELKNHYMDSCINLMKNGLSLEEATMVSNFRLGDSSLLSEEFEEVNFPIIQLRRILLIFAGILSFLIIYFSIQCTARILILVLYPLSIEINTKIQTIFSFVILAQFFLASGFVVLNFNYQKGFNLLKKIKINRGHVLGMFVCIILLAFADFELKRIVNNIIKPGMSMYNELYTLFDYTGYSLPFILTSFFIFAIRKYYKRLSDRSCLISSNVEVSQSDFKLDDSLFADEKIRNIHNENLIKLERCGLEMNEANLISLMRIGVYKKNVDQITPKNLDKNTNGDLFLLLSGVLVYFFLFYLLFSSSRIFFTALQYIDFIPFTNIKRTWMYTSAFQLIFIFLSISIYKRDTSLFKSLNRLNLRFSVILKLFFITLLFALVDRCFYPLSQRTLKNEPHLLTNLYMIFKITSYTFPIIIGSCFCFLYNKYYKEAYGNVSRKG